MAAAAALALQPLLLPVLLQASHALATAAGDAHPGYAGADADTCGPGLEEYGGGRIVGITHAYRPVMPGATVQPLVRLKESMEEGSDYNLSELRMECHTGTHVDAPGHMNQAHFVAGLDVDTLDLDVLNGARPRFSPRRTVYTLDIILVESLKLDNVNTGLYMLHCLPLRLVGSEGSPIRCILIK
ncbi:hypothetical protein ACQ4PT_029529 [Festuca glaucescens]